MPSSFILASLAIVTKSVPTFPSLCEEGMRIGHYSCYPWSGYTTFLCDDLSRATLLNAPVLVKRFCIFEVFMNLPGVGGQQFRPRSNDHNHNAL